MLTKSRVCLTLDETFHIVVQGNPTIFRIPWKDISQFSLFEYPLVILKYVIAANCSTSSVLRGVGSIRVGLVFNCWPFLAFKTENHYRRKWRNQRICFFHIVFHIIGLNVVVLLLPPLQPSLSVYFAFISSRSKKGGL